MGSKNKLHIVFLLLLPVFFLLASCEEQRPREIARTKTTKQPGPHTSNSVDRNGVTPPRPNPGEGGGGSTSSGSTSSGSTSSGSSSSGSSSSGSSSSGSSSSGSSSSGSTSSGSTSSGSNGGGASSDSPNIVFVLTDDQGYADLHANLPSNKQSSSEYKNIKKATVHMSNLAEKGVLFTDAHSNGPVCAISRAGILIGRYQQRAGFWQNDQSRDELPKFGKEKTIADVLKENGYKSSFVGKWHVGLRKHLHPLRRGFDYFYGFLGHGAHEYYDLTIKDPGSGTDIMENDQEVDEGRNKYLTDLITDKTIDFIKENKDNKFFAYVAYNAVHWPIEPPKSGEFSENCGSSNRSQMVCMLGRMDVGIKKILDTLEELSLTENTMVIVMGDNGGAGKVDADNYPLRDKKGSYYEGGIRVPLIISWPGKIASGEKFHKAVMGFDIFPTILGAANISVPDNLDGKNLLPYLKKESGSSSPEKTGEVHDFLVWDEDDGKYAVRKGDYKLINNKGDKELYDLSKDLGEKNNIRSSQSGKYKELEKIYEKWKEDMG